MIQSAGTLSTTLVEARDETVFSLGPPRVIKAWTPVGRLFRLGEVVRSVRALSCGSYDSTRTSPKICTYSSWNHPHKKQVCRCFNNQVTCRNPKLTTVSQSNATQVWNIAAIQSCHSLGERTSWWSFWAHALPPILNLAETPTTCTLWPAAFCLVDASKVVAIGWKSSPKRTQEEAIWTCVPTMSMVKAIHKDISALVLCELKVTDLCGFQVEQVVVTTAAETCDDRCIWSMTPTWMIKACSPVCLLFSAGQIPRSGYHLGVEKKGLGSWFRLVNEMYFAATRSCSFKILTKLITLDEYNHLSECVAIAWAFCHYSFILNKTGLDLTDTPTFVTSSAAKPRREARALALVSAEMKGMAVKTIPWLPTKKNNRKTKW